MGKSIGDDRIGLNAYYFAFSALYLFFPIFNFFKIKRHGIFSRKRYAYALTGASVVAVFLGLFLSVQAS
jgi:hypothetical protein